MNRLTRMISVLALLNVLGLGVVWFVHATIITKEGEVVQLQKEIADEKQKGAEFTTTQKVVTQAHKESVALDKYFSESGEEHQITFVEQLEDLATSTGVTLEIRSLDLASGATPSFHGELSMKGTWGEYYHFLRLIETFPGHLIISRFSATAVDRKISGLWTGSMSIDLVSVKNP
jgi:hypothetical protein